PKDGGGKQSEPLVATSVRGLDETRPTVPLNHELVQGLAVLSSQPLETEVVEDQKLGSNEQAEDLIERVVSTRLEQFFEEGVGAGDDDAVAGAHGGRAQALGEHGLADAHR